MNVMEPEGNSSKIFREVNNLNNDIKYFNSGVTFCDSNTANMLSNYMLHRLKIKLDQRVKTLTICY